jgi:hypothetical protein
VKAVDPTLFDPKERECLDASFRADETTRLMRNVVLGAVVLAALALYLWIIASEWALAGMLLVLIVAAVLDKARRVRETMRYRSVVRRLTHQLEDLEGVERSKERKQQKPLA